MVKVDNGNVVWSVAKKTWHANRKRNLLTILAISLTTFLIVSVLGIGIAYRQMIAERQIKMNGMDYDIELSEPTEEQIQTAYRMDTVKYAGVCVKCAVIETANDINISNTRLYWVDNTCWEKQCLPAFETVTGSYPADENEIMLSSAALRAMGIAEPEIGMDIPATYTPLADGSEETGYTFTLSGYYTDFTGEAKGYVSELFYQTTGVKTTDFTQGTLKLTLKNPIYTEKEIRSMEEQFSLTNGQYLSSDTYIMGRFIKTVLALGGLLILIFISGYLFIYNTLYLSVSRDIRYYGQLKTIGMTSVQLGKLIYIQAIWNGILGIPIGLIAGYFVIRRVIPAALVVTSSNAELAATSSFHGYPFLFFIAAIFSAVTIYISSRKPARIVGDCSPVQAVHYIGFYNRTGESEQGLKAFVIRNMFRDRKKAALILASFSVTLIIYLAINAVILENDSRRILNQTVAYDIQFRNETVLRKNEPLITEEQISQLEDLDGVETVRPVYSTEIRLPWQEDAYGEYYQELYDAFPSLGDYGEDISMYQNGEDTYGLFGSRLVAVDDAELALLLSAYDMDIDLEKFHEGEIALTASFIQVSPENAVGKTVQFTVQDEEYSIEIAGIVDNPNYFTGGYTPEIIVSENWFLQIVTEPVIELVYVDYKESYDEETEEQVKSIFEEETDISSDSRLDQYNDMLDNERNIQLLGNGLGFIIAFLALLNYINVMTANVQSRKMEFAILESIGMTTKQIRAALRKEGLGYAVISITSAVVIGIPVSYFAFQSLNTYQISFAVPVVSDLILFGIWLAISAVIPIWAHARLNKGSVIERLRAGEEI